MRKVAGLEYDTRGDGEPVLFIHGAIIADSFAPVMEEPTLAGYRLIRYRRRGYGRSDAPSDPPTIEEHARDARALLDGLDADRAHVVAHSGGGPIALQLAIDSPQVVRSLVLIEPALQMDARRLRWSFGTPRYVQLSRARAAGAALPKATTR